MSYIPRVTGGAALRTRSDDYSDDLRWFLGSNYLWIPAGIALIVGIVYLSRKHDICEGLCL